MLLAPRIGIPRNRDDPGAGRTGEEKEEKKKEEKNTYPQKRLSTGVQTS
jgi:hypothetical protein